MGTDPATGQAHLPSVPTAATSSSTRTAWPAAAAPPCGSPGCCSPSSAALTMAAEGHDLTGRITYYSWPDKGPPAELLEPPAAVYTAAQEITIPAPNRAG